VHILDWAGVDARRQLPPSRVPGGGRPAPRSLAGALPGREGLDDGVREPLDGVAQPPAALQLFHQAVVEPTERAGDAGQRPRVQHQLLLHVPPIQRHDRSVQ
jgi:hypothetical protein